MAEAEEEVRGVGGVKRNLTRLTSHQPLRLASVCGISDREMNKPAVHVSFFAKSQFIEESTLLET